MLMVQESWSLQTELENMAIFSQIFFSALMLLAGWQEGIWPVKAEW